MLEDFDARGQQNIYFFSLEEELWIMGSYFGQKQWIKVKNVYVSYKYSFSLYKTYIDGLKSCGLLWHF